MPCTIVVGGQYGSEGKGKVAALIASRSEQPWVVRSGGPNSGHSTSIDGKEVVVRQLPSGIGHGKSIALIPAGGVLDESVLIDEMDRFGIPRERVVVDPRAVLLLPSDRDWEQTNLQHISSTCSGTGSAQIRRLSRGKELILAGDSTSLRQRTRVENVASLLHHHLDRGGDVVVEGTQGFGLSLLHGLDYPCVTSRDTTAAGIISEVGLSPKQVDSIFMVLRTFPIRTGVNGQLPRETTWEEVQEISHAPAVIHEFASVTKRPRRVGHFNFEAVRLACQYNRPTALALMGLDRIDNLNRGIRDFAQLTDTARSFIDSVQTEIKIPISIVGTGFRSDEALWIPR